VVLKLPSTTAQDDSKAIMRLKMRKTIVPPRLPFPNVAACPDTIAPQDDLATEPDTLASGGEAVSPDGPSTPAEDLAEARRRFMAKRQNWFESAEVLALMREAQAAVDRYSW
jgi:hypothetical protein